MTSPRPAPSSYDGDPADFEAKVNEATERLELALRPDWMHPDTLRVLAEAENGDIAGKACATLAALVQKELG